MHFEKLPATVASGENKGKPAVVTISNSVLAGETDGKKNPAIVFEIPAADWEYPQFGPALPKKEDGSDARDYTDDEARQVIEEFVQNAGSVQRAAHVINDATRTASVNTGKGKIRTAPQSAGTREQIVESGLLATRNFTWAEEKKVSVAEIRSTIEDIKNVGLENLSEEELRARLAKLLG